MKSDIEILKFFRRGIARLPLSFSVGGSLSDRGRPAGSDKEDIVLSVLASESAGQMQTAFVNVNIYVRDVYNEGTRSWERDTLRCSEICDMAKAVYLLRGGDFICDMSGSTPPRVIATGVEFEDGHTEHCVSCKIFVRINNE